jgi:hypothetical protein
VLVLLCPSSDEFKRGGSETIIVCATYQRERESLQAGKEDFRNQLLVVPDACLFDLFLVILKGDFLHFENEHSQK